MGPGLGVDWVQQHQVLGNLCSLPLQTCFFIVRNLVGCVSIASRSASCLDDARAKIAALAARKCPSIRVLAEASPWPPAPPNNDFPSVAVRLQKWLLEASRTSPASANKGQQAPNTRPVPLAVRSTPQPGCTHALPPRPSNSRCERFPLRYRRDAFARAFPCSAD